MVRHCRLLTGPGAEASWPCRGTLEHSGSWLWWCSSPFQVRDEECWGWDQHKVTQEVCDVLWCPRFPAWLLSQSGLWPVPFSLFFFQSQCSVNPSPTGRNKIYFVILHPSLSLGNISRAVFRWAFHTHLSTYEHVSFFPAPGYPCSGMIPGLWKLGTTFASLAGRCLLPTANVQPIKPLFRPIFPAAPARSCPAALPPGTGW